MANELTWHDVLAEEKQQPYFLNTLQTVASERQSGVTIYPPQKDVFNAFRFTALGDVKVVILGGILITDRDRRMVWHFPFAPALRHRRHC